MNKMLIAHKLQLPPASAAQLQAEAEVRAAKIATTTALLAADRARAKDTLLQLQYQFSRHTSTIEVK